MICLRKNVTITSANITTMAMATRTAAEPVTKFADMMSAMGTEPRLRIMRLLLSAHPDGLVVGDYYKEGLAINQTLERDDAARALGLAATLKSANGTLMLTLAGHLKTYPGQLILTLAHPTHQGLDHVLTLHLTGAGRYLAALPAMPDGKWHAQLVDAASTWRLAGVLHSPFRQPATLSPDPIVQQPQGD